MTSLSTAVQERVALVTGGTFGIGRATAQALAKQGLTVVITGRDAARAGEAVAAIQRESGNGRVSFLLADFFRPAQVQALALEYARAHERLDILVNNAGGTFNQRQLTPEGFERTWALNHLAYMGLTLALLPLLRASAPARIVNVASGWYAKTLDLGNLQGERRYSAGSAYLRSKLANHLFTAALARRLAGSGVTVNAVNPGIVDTGLSRDARGLNKLAYLLLKPLQKTPEQGAFPSVYLATAPEVEGVSGRFYNKTKFVETAPIVDDQAMQDKLWQLSLQQLALGGADRLPDAPAIEAGRSL